MHDIDISNQRELEADEFEQLEHWEAEGEQEYLEAGEFEFEQHEAESLFCKNGEMCEAQETELALELLEVTNEAELEAFLGNLARKALQAGKSILSSPDMRAVTGILKGAAKQALPDIGSAIGGYFGGKEWAKKGAGFATDAGKLFGLELEGLSGEDQEFEVAKGVVRFAGHAAYNMTNMAGRSNPLDAARKAAVAAARVYAPGLLAETSQSIAGTTAAARPSSSSFAQSGTWECKHGKIIVHGVWAER